MLKKRIYVQPISNKADFGWQVLEMNIIEAFITDIRRYGLYVAVHNVIWMIVKGMR